MGTNRATADLPQALTLAEYKADDGMHAAVVEQHFAAAFHLGRLLLDDPDNAELKRRRDEALKRHAAAKK